MLPPLLVKGCEGEKTHSPREKRGISRFLGDPGISPPEILELD